MKRVQHMVLVKLKPSAEPSWPGIVSSLKGLQRHLPGMVHFAAGPYSSPEGLNQGFTHGILITFATPVDRNLYLAHPEHDRIKTATLPLLDGIIAFDFEE